MLAVQLTPSFINLGGRKKYFSSHQQQQPSLNTSYKFPRSIAKWPFCIQNSPCLISFAYSFRWRQTAIVLHRGKPYKASNGNHNVPKQRYDTDCPPPRPPPPTQAFLGALVFRPPLWGGTKYQLP